jgi:biotin carboxylase
MEEIFKVPGLMEFSINKKEGDFVTSRPQKNMDALGHITVVGENRQQAVQRANEAISKLTIAVSEGV